MSLVNVFYLMCSEYVYVSINKASADELVWFSLLTSHFTSISSVAAPDNGRVLSAGHRRPWLC